MEVSIKKNARLITGVGVAWLFDAMDVGLLSFVIAALKGEWALNTVQMGWIGSVSSLGMAIGAILFGILADRIGRKKVLLITLMMFSLGSLASAFASGLMVFLILRLLIGAGLGGELPVASTLVSESVAPAHRGRAVVLLESFWAAGWLVSALIAYYVMPTWGWRAALILTGLCALYGLWMREGIQESPQFTGETTKPSFMAAMKAIWAKEHLRATIMLWIVWFMVVFSYYGMFLWLPSVMVMKGFSMINSFAYVLIMTLAQLPGYFTAAWLIEKWGRKKVLATFLIGTAISAFGFGMATSAVTLIISGILLSYFNLGAWGALYAYSPEQYPTAVRSSGSGLAAGVGRIGGIVGPMFVGALLTQGVGFTTIFGIFTIAVLIAVAAVVFLGRETMVKAD